MDQSTISMAEVRDRRDPSKKGNFKAKIAAEGNQELTVYYVSPYSSNTQGGFVAIPEVGTTILVCKPVGSSSWYYLGSTFEQENRDSQGDIVSEVNIQSIERVDPDLYKARGVPMRYSLKSPTGAGLTISDEYSPEFINKKVELKSASGKKVLLHDGPNIDSIILDSGNGSRVVVSDDPQNQSLSARGIQIESVGPQKYLNSGSQTDIVVGEGGRELQILNNANGTGGGPGGNAGNVNIQSKWKDVNIFTQAASGRIFIECLDKSGANQQIVIETNGPGGGIKIKTLGDVTIDAGQNLDLIATNIRMQAKAKFSLNANILDIISNGIVNIDGQAINLATPTTPDLPIPVVEQSDYGDLGVTTY